MVDKRKTSSLSQKNTIYNLTNGDSLKCYRKWGTPDVIISDGAYGMGGFPGDPRSPERLVEWYEPHVRQWATRATAKTTLWLWNTEIGWAHIHPLLNRYGWRYVQTVVWDKGIAHVAGNVNSKTIRQFPVVTEISVLYEREPSLVLGSPNIRHGDVTISLKKWLRDEWLRTGLPLKEANTACGVANVATRKYLTQDHLWYMPPWEQMQKLIFYANRYGKPEGKPYFAPPQKQNRLLTEKFWEDQREMWSQEKWENNRRGWNHAHGVTNVWNEPSLRNSERLNHSTLRSNKKFAHPNQKPLTLLRRQILASTNKNGVVWEPFAGTASASVAAVIEGRYPYAAEINTRYYLHAKKRLQECAMTVT